MSQDYIEVKECSICGSQNFTKRDTRIDGLAVLECAHCNMGTVERYPVDLSVLYDEVYYSGVDSVHLVTHGYNNYQEVAAHSLSWVIQLIRLLCPSGNILDVGCANGYILKSLDRAYNTYGIEVNESMISECLSQGIKIIGRDITDKAALEQYDSMFDVITGIAVLEHVNNMKSALKNIKDMLSDNGVFVFEVPLMSDIHDNNIWLKSSLEHIYYPTIAGLQYVVSEIFGLPLIGHEVHVRDYGNLFVGIITLNKQRHAELEHLHQRLFQEAVSDQITEEERALRFLFDVVHSAETTPATVSLLEYVPLNLVTTHLLRRISHIWHHDAAQRDLLSAQNLAFEQQLYETAIDYHNQRAWNQTQTENYQKDLDNWKRLDEQRTQWIGHLEEARNYHEQQAQNWQAVASEAQAVADAAQLEIQVLTTERDILARERSALLNESFLSSLKRQMRTLRRIIGRARPMAE